MTLHHFSAARAIHACSAGLVLLAFAACASAGGRPPDISDTAFERSLAINLATMTRTPSGVYYEDVKPGDGDVIRAKKQVTIKYTGWLPNGNKFDSNADGIEFMFSAGRVIRGWDDGLEGMRVGGIRKLVIPPELGYGFRDAGKIPAGSVLVFRVEVVRMR
jgi:peptidylprolyl isomerase